MYSEAKLAFFIYLWYPKTKVLWDSFLVLENELMCLYNHLFDFLPHFFYLIFV